MATASNVLEAGRRLAGENEAVVGSNNTTINRHYGLPGTPYCGGFVLYCMGMAGCALLAGCSNPWLVSTLREYMETRGWPRVSTPQPGDVFIEGDDQHTGFCDMYLGNGYMLTLEGNWGHVRATETDAINGTGAAYEGIGYRKAAVTDGFRFYRPPYDASSGDTPAPEPVDLKAKVKDWQTWLGVDPDGDPGPDTERAAMRRMLLGMLQWNTLWPGDSGDAIKTLQGLLYAAGYNPNGLDGLYGSGCETAVRAFQADAGQDLDGCAGPMVVGALLDKVFG